jgi:hypothetical protein
MTSQEFFHKLHPFVAKTHNMKIGYGFVENRQFCVIIQLLLIGANIWELFW